ncbi:MAG TPA: hypothetical protein PKN04_10880 [bacterium]|nr:hypothetical protein [bacterium]
MSPVVDSFEYFFFVKIEPLLSDRQTGQHSATLLAAIYGVGLIPVIDLDVLFHT